MTRHAMALRGKAKGHTVTALPGRFEVVSGTSGKTYSVVPVLGAASCSCKWAAKRRVVTVACSHVLAVYQFAAEVLGKSISVWANEQDARRQHRPIQDVTDGIFLTVRG